MRDLVFVKSNPNHDARGRFAAGDEEAAHAGLIGATALEGVAGQHANDETKRTLRTIGRDALTTLHAKASELAGKARQAVQGMRLREINPTASGGIEIVASHRLANDRAHLESRLQLHPWGVKSPAVQQAIGVAHRALLSAGKRPVVAQGPFDVRFVNGSAPTRHTV